LIKKVYNPYTLLTLTDAFLAGLISPAGMVIFKNVHGRDLGNIRICRGMQSQYFDVEQFLASREQLAHAYRLVCMGVAGYAQHCDNIKEWTDSAGVSRATVPRSTKGEFPKIDVLL